MVFPPVRPSQMFEPSYSFRESPAGRFQVMLLGVVPFQNNDNWYEHNSQLMNPKF